MAATAIASLSSEREALIVENYHLVNYMATKLSYRHPGFDKDEIFSDCQFGLFKAAQDYQSGDRAFKSFALEAMERRARTGIRTARGLNRSSYAEEAGNSENISLLNDSRTVSLCQEAVDKRPIEEILPCPSQLPEELVLLKYEFERVMQVIDKLQPRQRQILLLHKYYDVELTAIAEQMGMSQPNASLILKKAVECTRQNLGIDEVQDKKLTHAERITNVLKAGDGKLSRLNSLVSPIDLLAKVLGCDYHRVSQVVRQMEREGRVVIEKKGRRIAAILLVENLRKAGND